MANDNQNQVLDEHTEAADSEKLLQNVPVSRKLKLQRQVQQQACLV